MKVYSLWVESQGVTLIKPIRVNNLLAWNFDRTTDDFQLVAHAPGAGGGHVHHHSWSEPLTQKVPVEMKEEQREMGSSPDNIIGAAGSSCAYSKQYI